MLLQTLPLQTPLEAAEQIRFSDTDYGADTTHLPPSGLSSFDQSIDASTVPPEHLTLVDSSTVPVPVPTVHLTSATEAQLLEDSPSCRSGLSSLPVPVPTTSPSGSSSTVPSTKVKRPRLKAGVPGDLPLLTSPLQTLTFQTPSEAAEQIRFSDPDYLADTTRLRSHTAQLEEFLALELSERRSSFVFRATNWQFRNMGERCNLHTAVLVVISCINESNCQPVFFDMAKQEYDDADKLTQIFLVCIFQHTIGRKQVNEPWVDSTFPTTEMFALLVESYYLLENDPNQPATFFLDKYLNLSACLRTLLLTRFDKATTSRNRIPIATGGERLRDLFVHFQRDAKVCYAHGTEALSVDHPITEAVMICANLLSFVAEPKQASRRVQLPVVAVADVLRKWETGYFSSCAGQALFYMSYPLPKVHCRILGINSAIMFDYLFDKQPRSLAQ